MSVTLSCARVWRSPWTAPVARRNRPPRPCEVTFAGHRDEVLQLAQQHGHSFSRRRKVLTMMCMQYAILSRTQLWIRVSEGAAAWSRAAHHQRGVACPGGVTESAEPSWWPTQTGSSGCGTTGGSHFGYSAADAAGQNLDLIIPRSCGRGTRRVTGSDATGITRYGDTLLSVPPPPGRASAVDRVQRGAAARRRRVIVGISAIMREISERREAEKALRPSSPTSRPVSRRARDVRAGWPEQALHVNVIRCVAPAPSRCSGHAASAAGDHHDQRRRMARRPCQQRPTHLTGIDSAARPG